MNVLKVNYLKVVLDEENYLMLFLRNLSLLLNEVICFRKIIVKVTKKSMHHTPKLISEQLLLGTKYWLSVVLLYVVIGTAIQCGLSPSRRLFPNLRFHRTLSFAPSFFSFSEVLHMSYNISKIFCSLQMQANSLSVHCVGYIITYLSFHTDNTWFSLIINNKTFFWHHINIPVSH